MSAPKVSRWRDEIARRTKASPGGWYLNDALPPDYSMNEYRAAHNAARNLARQKKIQVVLKFGKRTGARSWVTPGRKRLPEVPPLTEPQRLAPAMLALLRK